MPGERPTHLFGMPITYTDTPATQLPFTVLDLERLFERTPQFNGPCIMVIVPWPVGAARLWLARLERPAQPNGRQLFAVLYDAIWHYENWNDALSAMWAWNPETEPEPTGWVKHPASKRCRPGGNTSLEYVSE